MRFISTALAGVTIVEPEAHADARGLFARLHCIEEFAANGGFTPVQTSLSRNPVPHTLRGLHYRRAPEAEAKLVRVTRGAICDVVVDLRPGSASFRRHVAVELDAAGLRGLFIPAGCAHGFLTMQPDTDVLYQIDRTYRPGFDAGLRWDDPALGIVWPAEPAVMAERDAGWPLLDSRAATPSGGLRLGTHDPSSPFPRGRPQSDGGGGGGTESAASAADFTGGTGCAAQRVTAGAA